MFLQSCNTFPVPGRLALEAILKGVPGEALAITGGQLHHEDQMFCECFFIFKPVLSRDYQ
jgi:hypothetical protein